MRRHIIYCILAALLLLPSEGCQKKDVSEYYISLRRGDSIITLYGQDTEVTAAVDYIESVLIPHFKASHGDIVGRKFTIESDNGQASDEEAMLRLSSLAEDLFHTEYLGNERIKELGEDRTGAFSLCYVLNLACHSFIDHRHSPDMKEYRIYFNYIGSIPDSMKHQYEDLLLKQNSR